MQSVGGTYFRNVFQVHESLLFDRIYHIRQCALSCLMYINYCCWNVDAYCAGLWCVWVLIRSSIRYDNMLLMSMCLYDASSLFCPILGLIEVDFRFHGLCLMVDC